MFSCFQIGSPSQETVSDTGRIIPVNEIVYAIYTEYDYCMAYNQVVHVYLAG
jgi:hypothetical protein